MICKKCGFIILSYKPQKKEDELLSDAINFILQKETEGKFLCAVCQFREELKTMEKELNNIEPTKNLKKGADFINDLLLRISENGTKE